MSLITSPYLVKLQELKLWQGNYDNLLQKNKSLSLTNTSDIEGVEPLNNSILDHDISSQLPNWDKKAISPNKPFNELLEEKLAEDYLNKVPTKPKQPFLKKGTGLARYNLNPGILSTKTKKRSFSKPKSATNKHKQTLEKQDELTPLKAPEVAIKSKASWCKVTGNETEIPVSKSPIYKNNSENIIEKINELSLDTLIFNSPKDDPRSDDIGESAKFDYNRSDKELRLFEILEEKVEHSSFSSTNSSIRKLLSSTPHKNLNFSKQHNEINQQNSDVLTKILQNLKLISQKNLNEHITDSSAKKSSPDTTISEPDGEKWSNSNSRAQSPSSFYTEFETTLEKPERNDACVNTSFTDKNDSASTHFGQCFGCIQLQNQIEKLKKETPDITAEKAILYDFAKDLESKRDQLHQEIEYLKKKYEKDIEDLREELSTEKMKLSREKALLDSYLKGSRPTKKDRDIIETLKKELTDIKELMKLKDTKNGTTQARLRNHIKQLEKEKLEIKSSLENLQKENSKLSASQKINRNVDTKMLQEINRNLHRLTEETKQINKPETTTNPEKNNKPQRKFRRKSMGDLKDKIEKELDKQLNKTANNTTKHEQENSPPVEVIYNNKCTLSDLEKKYESTFGLHSENESLLKNFNVSKKDSTVISEKDFPDGSQELKYSNGTTKIISPDQKLIYVQYINGDIKETNLIKNIQKYYFMAKDVWLTKYADGIELVEFPTGQKEKKFPDGKIEVITADGTQLITYPGETQEINYPDGSKMVTTNDEKIIYLPNGQKETHKKEYKKREYPDGTVKILYPDGTQESRYGNGRVRIKDADGNLIVDSHIYETK